MKEIKVNCAAGARAFASQLLGHPPTDEELAALAGALDGAMVEVSVQQQKGWLYLTINDPARFERYETSVRKDPSGGLFGYIHHVYAAAGQSGQGYGVRAFLRQVKGARQLGLKRFELFAAGYAGAANEIGYYVWARFGFDARLRAEEQAALPLPLQGATTLNQLILSGGERWWKRSGTARSMNFDLADESAMMKVFRNYLREKGITEE